MYEDLPAKSQRYLARVHKIYLDEGYTEEEVDRIIQPTAASLYKFISKCQEDGMSMEEIEKRLVG